MEFRPFPKIPRLSRPVVVTEKLDGTNACIWIDDTGTQIRAGNRKRWITPQDDNHGFAKWVAENQLDLFNLGPGFHYGEWWGQGIQRGYGLKEKRFSLFNVKRWAEDRPACCHVVPSLWEGDFDTKLINECLHLLRTEGSFASPDFMNPEGIMIYHIHAGQYFKKTLEKDDVGKEE